MDVQEIFVCQDLSDLEPVTKWFNLEPSGRKFNYRLLHPTILFKAEQITEYECLKKKVEKT